MNSSAPSTCWAMNAASSAPRRSSSAATDQASSVSVPGNNCKMQIGLFGDLGAQRIDHHEPATFAFRLAHAAHDMQVGDGRVVAPHDIEFRVLGKLRRASGNGAVGAGPCLAAHAATHGAAIKLRRAELVEEPRRHAVAGEQAVRSGVVQRRHRLRTPAVDHRADPRMDFVQRRIPRDAFELSGAFRAGAAQRMQQALRSVHEGRHVLRDLVADDTSGERRRFRTTHLDDPLVLDSDAEAAGVRTIEGADAGAFDDSHLVTPGRAVSACERPRLPSCRAARNDNWYGLPCRLRRTGPRPTLMVTDPGKWQDTKCPGVTSVRCGVSSAQRADGGRAAGAEMAAGGRVDRARAPRPARRCGGRLRSRCGSGTGTAEISVLV